jgi:tripeptide aminopeptidase
VPIGLGIPAATVSGGGQAGGEHGPDEWYRAVDGYQGPQALLLTTLALAGLDGVTKPELPVRKRQP